MTAEPISVIVPTLNEAGNIRTLTERLHKTFLKNRVPYEIIMVDDHSTDGTIEEARKLQQFYPLRILSKQGKRGKAFSLLEGFSAAHYQLLCMIDADLQYPPEAIAVMYEKMLRTNADIVVTERVDKQTSGLRKLSSTVYNTIFTRMLFGVSYDSQSGLKLFKKRVIENMPLAPSPWTFDLEFLVRAMDKHSKIINQRIPFSERQSGEAKIHMISAVPEMIKASLRLKYRMIRQKHTAPSTSFRAAKKPLVVAGVLILSLGSSATASATDRNSYYNWGSSGFSIRWDGNRDRSKNTKQATTNSSGQSSKTSTTASPAITANTTPPATPLPTATPSTAGSTASVTPTPSATPASTTTKPKAITATAAAAPTNTDPPQPTPTIPSAIEKPPASASQANIFTPQTFSAAQTKTYLDGAYYAVLAGLIVLAVACLSSAYAAISRRLNVAYARKTVREL